MIWNGQNSVRIDSKKRLNSYFLLQEKHRFVLLIVSYVSLVAAEKNE